MSFEKLQTTIGICVPRVEMGNSHEFGENCRSLRLLFSNELHAKKPNRK